MFERFTDKARTAVIAARAEAAERGDQIRPVYLLHALAAGDGVAARPWPAWASTPRHRAQAGPRRTATPPPGGDDAEALASIGIDLDEIGAGSRRASARRARPVPGRPARDREDRDDPGGEAVGRARRQGSPGPAPRYVGTEHLLLGLIGAAQRNPRGDFGPQTAVASCASRSAHSASAAGAGPVTAARFRPELRRWRVTLPWIYRPNC